MIFFLPTEAYNPICNLFYLVSVGGVASFGSSIRLLLRRTLLRSVRYSAFLFHAKAQRFRKAIQKDFVTCGLNLAALREILIESVNFPRH